MYTSVSITDRIVSALSYFTFGIFSLVWIIFANVVGRPISAFVGFNIYQAIFLSVILAAVSMLYQIAFGFLTAIPVVKDFAIQFNLIFFATPVYMGFTISGLLILLLLCYLIILSLFGKRPYIPFVSDVVTGIGG